jgi:hypothetical protein
MSQAVVEHSCQGGRLVRAEGVRHQGPGSRVDRRDPPGRRRARTSPSSRRSGMDPSRRRHHSRGSASPAAIHPNRARSAVVRTPPGRPRTRGSGSHTATWPGTISSVPKTRNTTRLPIFVISGHFVGRAFQPDAGRIGPDGIRLGKTDLGLGLLVGKGGIDVRRTSEANSGGYRILLRRPGELVRFGSGRARLGQNPIAFTLPPCGSRPLPRCGRRSSHW